MEGKLKSFFHTFLLVMASVIVWNVIVKPYTPASIAAYVPF